MILVHRGGVDDGVGAHSKAPHTPEMAQRGYHQRGSVRVQRSRGLQPPEDVQEVDCPERYQHYDDVA